jgi:hypothetical protein
MSVIHESRIPFECTKNIESMISVQAVVGGKICKIQ